MKRRPRGRCTHCGRTKALTKDGKVWRHKMRGRDTICGGSGGRPA